jgi:tRNA(Ile2) C34 agmatinyltransferase TiaS
MNSEGIYRKKVALPEIDEAIARNSPIEARHEKACLYCGEIILAVAKKCRFCGEMLSNTQQNRGAAENATENMFIFGDAVSFSCPHCSKRIRVAGDKAGTAGRCPSCRKIIRVPSESEV